MFKNFKYHSILKSKTIAGVEAVFLPDGGLIFNAVVLKKSKSGLEVEAFHTGIKDIEELQKELDSKLPINIVINGKGIIHKKIAVSEGENEGKLLEKVFPNAKVNDFYIQKKELSANTIFISLVRKSTVDDLLAAFINKGYFFSGISLGPFCINGIIPLMNLSADGFSIGNYKFSLFDNGSIDDFQDNNITLSEDIILIAGEEIKQQAALAFAAAFQYFFSEPGEGSMIVPIVNESKSELEQKKLFQMGGWTALLIFLVILLCNFLLFNNYQNQFQKMNSAFLGKKEQLEIVNELKIKVKEKQAFFKKAGLKGVSKTSYYADRIALDLPETIQLTQLYLHPPEKKIKNNEPVIFLNNIIIVKGNCKKSIELNEWIRSIKKMEWVNDVSVISYKQENFKDPGEFEIKITIT